MLGTILHTPTVCRTCEGTVGWQATAAVCSGENLMTNIDR